MSTNGGDIGSCNSVIWKVIAIVVAAAFLSSTYAGLVMWSMHSKFGEERYPVLMRLHRGGEWHSRARSRVADYPGWKRRWLAIWGASLSAVSIVAEVWLVSSVLPHIWA